MANPSKKMKLVLGSDHAGFDVKNELVAMLSDEDYRVLDVGASSDESSDYPDYALKVSKVVASGRADRGLLVCGSGMGMSIMANKVKGIRACAIWSVTTARLASEHNWCNVLCLSARFTSLANLKKQVRAWLKTPFDKGGRHERRVKKILKYEAKS